MKKIGIIGAMAAEIDGLLAAFDGKAEETSLLYGSTFYSGEVNGHPVVVVRSGIGKVNAAFTATVLALKFNVAEIVMTGIAGGLGGKTLDAVVPDGFVQHDVSMPGEADGHIDIVDAVVIPADKTLKEALLGGGKSGGLIATGEAFVSSREAGAEILRKFPGAVAVDMECAAAAQACSRMGIPFAAVKIISDGCDDAEYFDFFGDAAEKSIAAVLKLLL